MYPGIKFDTRETVKIEKLDNIELDQSLYNMINIDVQGFELEVFKGAQDTLQYIDIIYTEINLEQVYKGCCQVEDLDAFWLIPNETSIAAYIVWLEGAKKMIDYVNNVAKLKRGLGGGGV